MVTQRGAILTMERALQNLCAATERPLGELWVTSGLNAARVIGISSRKGSLEAGKDANLVLLDESFQVHLIMAQGDEPLSPCMQIPTCVGRFLYANSMVYSGRLKGPHVKIVLT